MTVHIGQWIRRERRPVGHLVESVIAGDAVTRCGRRLSDERNSRGALVEAEFGIPKCSQCIGYIEKESQS